MEVYVGGFEIGMKSQVSRCVASLVSLRHQDAKVESRTHRVDGAGCGSGALLARIIDRVMLPGQRRE